MFTEGIVPEKEAIETFAIWSAEKQRECDESGGEYSRLKFNVDVAELLDAANLTADAREYCDGAWEILHSEIARAGGEENMSEELRALRDRLVEIHDRAEFD